METANLVAIARADGDTLAAFGTPARKHRGAAFRLHAAAEAVRLRAAAAVGLKSTLGHGKTSLLIFSISAGCASRRFADFQDAQRLRLAAQLQRTSLIAARIEYISSHFYPQKSRPLTFFTSIGATFVRAKFFCSDVASLRLRLCYYRQRSLKIFSTPCGCRKEFFDRRSDA
jgi:hypothetical protein